MIGCCSLPEKFTIPKCDYMLPVVKKLWIRKNTKEQVQIKINGERKWRDVEYNEEAKTITYLL